MTEEATKPTKTTRTSTRKPTRKPVGLRTLDETPQRKGYYRRWVNDVGNRLERFIEGGYQAVTNKDGEIEKRLSSKSSIAQVLMEIPLEFYNEDQKAKFKKDAELVSDKVSAINKKEGQYKPKRV